METILLVLVIGILCIVCFFIGARVGQKVVKGEEIKAPSISKLNPINIYKEHQEKEEQDKEKKKIETILKNIERYDGTDAGQEDVPM
jgi:uncharacterized protein YneF (UPF0154 family)